MSIRELILQPKCGSSLRVSLQEEDPIAVFVGSSNAHVQLELSACPQLIISLPHFGLDPFMGVCPGNYHWSEILPSFPTAGDS